MHRCVLAFDFDGTLAENDIMPPQIHTALERLHTAGYLLFLVTGWLTESVPLGALSDLLTGIVWKNGAVLYDSAKRETYLPFVQLDRHLVDTLIAAGVPLEHGQAVT